MGFGDCGEEVEGRSREGLLSFWTSPQLSLRLVTKAVSVLRGKGVECTFRGSRT
jgi:hypothetical protein